MAYYLQTTPGVLVILVRHGSTALNGPKKRSVRGWKDDPLTPQGEEEVRETARRLRDYAPQSIASSDFMRDTGTKMILANHLGISDLHTDYDARTWDVGQFSGQPEDEVNPALVDLYTNRPWEAPPGSGESFNGFAARWLGFLDRRMQTATIEGMRPGIIVTHGRNIALSDAHFNFKPPEQGVMPPPAGYAVLSVDLDRRLQLDMVGETEPVLLDI